MRSRQFFNFRRDCKKCLTVLSTSNLSLHKLSSRIYNLKLERKEGKNAFSKSMVFDFNDAIRYLIDGDHAASVLVLSSSVDRVFCAGADLKERLEMTENEVGSFVGTLRVSFTILLIVFK